MRRLRPTDQSRRVVADWCTTATQEHKRRMAELLRTLADGSWEDRWKPLPYSSNPDVIGVSIDTYVQVFMRVFLDEDDHELYADIFTIETGGPSG